MCRMLFFSIFAALPTPSFAQFDANRADLIERMEQADANQDGVITRAELIDWRKANFARFDRNGDGVLSDTDMPKLLRGTSMSAQFDRLKAQFDANRDGRVTRQEFVGAPTVLFDAADYNHDGQLTRGERDAAVTTAQAAKS